MTERFELIGAQQAKELAELKLHVQKIGYLMTDVALQKQRLDSQSERLNTIDRRMDEMRHGQGFIQHTADGEYGR